MVFVNAMMLVYEKRVGKHMKKIIFVFTNFLMITAFVFIMFMNTEAKVRMNKRNITLTVSQKYILKLKGYKGKVNWKSSKPGVAKVSKNGKVIALKKGRSTITAKIKKNRYKCVVMVKYKKKMSETAAKPYTETIISTGLF